VLLRVGYGHADAMVQLANKFGCHPDEADALIRAARDRGLTPDGVCFHVGSQSPDSSAHVLAIEASRAFFLRHQDMSILDIGGGFPVRYHEPVPDIETFCAPIRKALTRVPSHVRVIAEPGRYLAAPCVTALAAVMGTSERAGKRWYFLDDGVYGSFSGRIFDHARYPLKALAPRSDVMYSCVVAGPTCDGLDVIDDDAILPMLATGDLVLAQMMGGYTVASATLFNSFPVAPLVAINEAPVRPID
jgi:ornithine decarboxylase